MKSAKGGRENTAGASPRPTILHSAFCILVTPVIFRLNFLHGEGHHFPIDVPLTAKCQGVSYGEGIG